MATDPKRHPLDEEIAEIYDSDPELKDQLDRMEDELDRGELEGVDHEEMRRRFRLLGGDHS